MTTTYTSTPRRSLGRPRPSLNPSGHHPPMPSPMLSPSSLIARKQSFNQLTQNSSSKDSGYGGDTASDSGVNGLEIGDSVNVPGGMYGVVRFLGSVKGKPGMFVGVELEGPHAVKGKNDGTVEGTRYFTTSTPHSGIFLPISRATLRHSAGSSSSGTADLPPPTPTVMTTPPSDNTQFPDESPLQLPKKPFAKSIPRPESPGSKGSGPRPSLLPSTPGQRKVSTASSRLMSPSPTPGKPFSSGRSRAGSTASERGDGVSYAQTPAALRTPGGRLGGGLQTQSHHNLRGAGLKKPSFGGALATPRAGSAMSNRGEPMSPVEEMPRDAARIVNGRKITSREEDQGTIAALKAQLSAKDHQLKEQAHSILEMESSLTELQTLVVKEAAAAENRSRQSNASTHYSSGSGGDRERVPHDDTEAHLRAIIREKNEKIAQLNADFDAHRADFRSTIDTLELAASETERVYEKRVEDLLADCRELERQRQELAEVQMRRDEEDSPGSVEGVARQLKQLEGLVAELEEGLEDARRGESEARGDAEHCRGESERAKEELRREKEKARAFERRVDELKKAAASSEAEVERRSDEIRGLKAIIHSLSRDKVTNDTASNRGSGTSSKEGDALTKERQAREKLEKEVQELESVVERKVFREEELEKEIERLKSASPTIMRAPPRSDSLEHQQRSKHVRINDSVSGASIPLPSSRPESLARRDSNEEKRETPRESWRSAESRLNGANGNSDAVSIRSNRSEARRSTANASIASRSSYRRNKAGENNIDEDYEDAPMEDGQWCEICEAAGHDILTCTNMFTKKSTVPNRQSQPIDERDVVAPLQTRKSPAVSPVLEKASPALTDTTPASENLVAGRESGVADPNKWCALCEADGHDSVDCPVEDF